MSFYQKHVFMCTHERTDGTACCQRYNAQKMQKYMKQKVKGLGKHSLNQIRINRSGCLGLCEQGPAMVVYPDNIWYSWIDEDDLDEIIEQHLVNGKPVERLRIHP
jgi:(2Fe-2S) ferredoxin